MADLTSWYGSYIFYSGIVNIHVIYFRKVEFIMHIFVLTFFNLLFMNIFTFYEIFFEKVT